jgi:hypothetical protein
MVRRSCFAARRQLVPDRRWRKAARYCAAQGRGSLAHGGEGASGSLQQIRPTPPEFAGQGICRQPPVCDPLEPHLMFWECGLGNTMAAMCRCNDHVIRIMSMKCESIDMFN